MRCSPAQRAFEFRIKFVQANGSKKAKMSQIDRKQRNVAARHYPCRRKQRAVTAQNHHHVSAVRQFIARIEGAQSRIFRRLLIAAVFDPALIEPGQQVAHNIARLRDFRFGYNSDRRNLLHPLFAGLS